MFKKGDVVRIIATYVNNIPNGTLGVVEDYSPALDIVKFKVDGHPVPFHWYARRFELVKEKEEFAVGDMIVANDVSGVSRLLTPVQQYKVLRVDAQGWPRIECDDETERFLNKDRFTKAIMPAAKPIPLTKENVRVGMKVILNSLTNIVENHYGAHLIGKEVTIHSFVPNSDSMIYLEEWKEQPLKLHRFTLTPAAPVVAPGCKLIVIEAHRESGLRKDRIVTLKKISKAGHYLLEEYAGYYAARRFQLVGAAAKPVVVKPIAVGDMVYVVERHAVPLDNWTTSMEKYLNDGIAYRVNSISTTGDIRLIMEDGWRDDGVMVWAFNPKCLSHTPNGHAVPAPIPTPPKFKVGDKVYVVNDKGSQYLSDFKGTDEIKTVYLVNKETKKIYLQDMFTWFDEDNFVLATPENKPPPPPPYAGDLRKELRDLTYAREITPFAFVKNNKKAVYATQPPCYGELSSVKEPISHLVLCSKAHNKDKTTHAYVEYILNKSPWAPCFVTKALEEALSLGVEMDTNKPIGELVGAATAFREATEYNIRIPMFNLVLEEGFDGHVAYLAGVYFSENAGGNYSVNAAGSGHTVLDETLFSDSIIKFFTNGYIDNGKPAANVKMEAYSVTKWIGACGNGGPSMAAYIKQSTDVTTFGDGWGKKEFVTKKALIKFLNVLQQAIQGVKK
jgi:hypothetical protein